MGTTFRFSELRKLHALGFTLHWLRPNSKAPFPGWAKAPRKDFEEFKRGYQKGYNVGVRLGKTSRIGKNYLAVIDLDVKGVKPEHQKQAREKLFELFPEAKTAPCVVSGRGNGSAHYYIQVSEPIQGNERKGQSSEIVKVRMPSHEPSKKEKEKLTAAELAEGFRLRPAWEISLLCEGRQVVLPGSVHPDSGRTYQWAEGADPYTLQMPLIPLARLKTTRTVETSFLGEGGAATAPVDAFQFVPVEVEDLGLRPDQVAAIKIGAGVTDRSASLFALSMALLQRSRTENEILSVFTDRRYYLGETPFDHAKTNSRVAAARWLLKYTLPRARSQVSQSAFQHEVKEEPNGQDSPKTENSSSSRGVSEAFSEAGDWKQELDLKPGPKGAPPEIRPTFKNLCLILKNTVGLDFLRFDDFAHREFWAYDVPWGPKEGDQRSAGTQDEIKLKSWFIEVWGIEASINMLTETLAWFSGQNHFHPVKDYLDTLEWDGTPRIEKAFHTYLGARMNPAYLDAVSKKFFLALMARVYQPGCKFDHLPVLEGAQGIGKSTFGRMLVGDKWFMDGLPDLSDKDAALNLTGIWLCEMSELSSLYRSQLEVAKAFITRQVDKVRPPYGARRVELPRQTVFLGTTNDRDYLVDETGNRRFWPVLIHGCDFKRLARDREQLLAEAHWCYMTEMEPLYLRGRALRLAEEIQESRRVEDDVDSIRFKISEWLSQPASKRSLKDVSQLRIDDLFDSGPLFGMQKNTTTRKKTANVLRESGYVRTHGRNGRYWVKSK